MIEFENIEKRYGKYFVLKGINLSIKNGLTSAIVGPNGSGKTTLIKTILDLVKLNKGVITINKYRLNGDCNYRRKIGYMPQFSKYPENLKVEELFSMIKDIRAEEKNYDLELFENFEMKNILSKQIKTLSGGTRQKLSATVAFMFNPDIIILDEPTASLDPLASSILKDKILSEKKKNKTIIITSHNMNDVEEVSDNLVFIIDGKITFDGTIENLKMQTNKDNLERAVSILMGEAK